MKRRLSVWICTVEPSFAAVRRVRLWSSHSRSIHHLFRMHHRFQPFLLLHIPNLVELIATIISVRH